MFKKAMTVTSACFLLLVGCEKTEQKEQLSTASEEKFNIQQQVSKTAIYLPGGAGVDFGVKPVIDKERKNDKGIIKYLSYELPSDYASIDNALAEILNKDGYRRENKGSTKDYNSVVSYRKPGNHSVLIRYQSYVREGFDKGTKVNISWYR